jgi:hypothetical protein
MGLMRSAALFGAPEALLFACRSVACRSAERLRRLDLNDLRFISKKVLAFSWRVIRISRRMLASR